MFANLSTATGSTSAFSWTSVIILLVAAAIFYPVQKWLRGNVSRRRKERWAEEDRQAQERLRLQDEPRPVQPPDDDQHPDVQRPDVQRPDDRST